VNVVCVPYRPDTPERIANWDRTREQWEGWEVFHYDSDGETFARAQACNRAADMAGNWDVAVFADSDLLLANVSQAATALKVARKNRGYVVCYDVFYYLNEKMSRRVRKGAQPIPDMAYYSLTQIYGGMFAIHRRLWDSLRGFDERFKSWGGEDGNFLTRVDETGTRKNRVVGAAYHLKHPLAPGAR
jgi:predicted glycosyltransferase involved in capsule biosynthesis